VELHDGVLKRIADFVENRRKEEKAADKRDSDAREAKSAAAREAKSRSKRWPVCLVTMRA
jgi:hypothetical protein